RLPRSLALTQARNAGSVAARAQRSVRHVAVLRALAADGWTRSSVDVLDPSHASATPAQPEAVAVNHDNPLSALQRVVSRVGIVPERRGRRPKPQRLRITGRNP